MEFGYVELVKLSSFVVLLAATLYALNEIVLKDRRPKN